MDTPKKPKLPLYNGTDLNQRYLIVPSRWGYSIFDCGTNTMLRGIHTTAYKCRQIIANELDTQYMAELLKYHEALIKLSKPISAKI